jgi:hypothetical protein
VNDNQEQIPPQAKQRKKRQARRALSAFLKRLRKACDTFSTADDWYQFIRDNFDPIIEEYQEGLGVTQQQRLKDATRLTDSTREGISKACETLELEIKTVVGVSVIPVSALILGAVIVLAGVVGATVVALNLFSAEMTIRNNGGIGLPAELDRIPGVSIPTTSIDTDEEVVLELPPFAVTIDTTREDNLRLTALGAINIDRFVDISDEVMSIGFDDQPDLLGRRITLDIRPGSHHELVINCR